MNVIIQGLFWLYMGPVFGRNLVLGLICNPGEYEIKGECCPMCAPGKVVSKDCTISGNTVCVPCVDGTYMDHINAVLKCLRCRECDSGSGLTVEQECTYQSNTKCKCKDGYFCNRKDCDLCQPFKECQPGERVKEYGTLYSDTVCEPCQEGTYSNELMSSTCHKWTKCSEVGLKEDQSGTSTLDSVCSSNLEFRNKFVLIAPFCFILLLLIFVLKKTGKEKKQAQMETAEKPVIKVQTPMETDDGMCESRNPEQEQCGR